MSVRVDARQRSASIDFSGTSPQLTNNFNAPRAITTAAVLYVFRTLVDDDIPLNAGCLKPLQIILPEALHAEPAIRRPPSSPAMSRPRPASRMPCSARWASWRRANAP